MLLVLLLGAPLSPSLGQSLESQLDEDRFLRGLSELHLPEVLEHYLSGRGRGDAVQAALHTIAVQRMAAGRPGRPPAERVVELEAMLAVRRELVDRHPSHPDRAVWLADQAFDLLFEYLPADGADLTVLFGLPAPAQRARVSAAVEEMNRVAGQAELAVEQAILALESSPGYRDDLARQRRRRQLAEEQRDRRIPFLRGIAACLHAEVNDRDGRELFEIAADALGPLAGELEGMLAARARLWAAVATFRLGERDAAAGLLDEVARDPAALRRDQFAARAARVEHALEVEGAEPALRRLESWRDQFAGPGDLFYMVLAADLEFRLRLRLADAAGPDQARPRERKLAEAYRAYVELLDAPSDAPRETLEAVVSARLVRAVDDRTPLAALPALVSIARAGALARADSTLGEAIELYGAILARPDLAERDRAAALFGLGWAQQQAGRTMDAANHFAALAETIPGDHRAERAMEIAAALAARRYAEAPADAAVRAALRRTLDVLLDRYVNLDSVDRWRYLAGRVALNDRRFEDAYAQFEQVTRGAAEWPDSRFMIANGRRTEVRSAESETERQRLARALLEAIDPVRAALQAALDRDGGERVAELRYYLAYLRVFEAEARLVIGQPQAAVDALAGLESDASLDGAVIAAALETRIDAFQALGRPQEAQREVERFVAAAPQQVPRVVPPMMDAIQAGVEERLDHSLDDEAGTMAETELLPLAEVLERWLADAPAVEPETRESVERRIAAAYRLAGRFEAALGHYDRLLGAHPDAESLLVGRAECLFGLGGDGLAEAMRLYRRLGASASEAGGGAWWLAQVRMLQILDQVGRNTQKIAPRIERLRRQDAELGGERFRRMLDALQRKYG